MKNFQMKKLSYNEEIRKFEEGNFENLTEVSVEELEKRISILKHRLEKK